MYNVISSKGERTIKEKEEAKMYVLKHQSDNNIIVGWDLETGKHGLFTHTVQQATFETEAEAWNYMDLLERIGIDVGNITVKEI